MKCACILGKKNPTYSILPTMLIIHKIITKKLFFCKQNPSLLIIFTLHSLFTWFFTLLSFIFININIISVLEIKDLRKIPFLCWKWKKLEDTLKSVSEKNREWIFSLIISLGMVYSTTVVTQKSFGECSLSIMRPN